MKVVLYYWAKENPIISYRQGMNEVLSIIFFVFYAELTSFDPNTQSTENTDDLIDFMNDKKNVIADIFTVFERIMNLGIKELYGTNNDISQIKKLSKHNK